MANRISIHIFVFFILVFHSGKIAMADSEAVHEIIIKGIEANFSGDYDQASDIFSSLQQVDPKHPARPFYQAVVLFWRNSLDPGNPSYQGKVRQLLKQSLDLAEQMLDADTNDVDALHYLGLAYTYLGRLEAHDGKLYKGGVLGERGRKYLERAIEICQDRNFKNPTETSAECRSCEDIYFPYGAYSYFAGRLPQFLQTLNFLWFIPSGSTDEGISALERAYGNSALHGLGAKSLLVEIFLNFEAEHIKTARKLSGELISRFPDNPYLEVQHATILITSGDHHSAVQRTRKILDKIERGVRNYDEIVRQRVLLVQAEAAIRDGDMGTAGRILALLKNCPSYQSNSLTPHTDLLLGMQADIEMQREIATQHYERAKSYKGAQHNRMVARKAKEFLQNPFSNFM